MFPNVFSTPGEVYSLSCAGLAFMTKHRSLLYADGGG